MTDFEHLSSLLENRDLGDTEIQELRNHRRSINQYIDSNGNSLMMRHCDAVDSGTFFELLGFSPDPNIVNQRGETVLTLLTRVSVFYREAYRTTYPLIDRKAADVDANGAVDAATSPHSPCLDQLLLAIYENNSSLTGIDCNAIQNGPSTSYTWTALMCAAMYGRVECIYTLRDKFSIQWLCPLAVNQNGYSALSIAAAGGHVDCMRALFDCFLSNNDQLDLSNDLVLHQAVDNQFPACITAMHALYPSCNINLIHRNMTALSIATRYGYADCIIALSAFADLEPNLELDSEDMTSIMIAAENGHAECIRALSHVKQAVDSTAETWEGLSAMLLAVQNNHADCILALAETFPETTNALLETFAYAISHGHVKCIQALFQISPSIGLDFEQHYSPSLLHQAVSSGDSACLSMICNFVPNLDCNCRNEFGQTVLMVASMNASCAFIQQFAVIFGDNIDVNAQCHIKRTALMYAADRSSSHCVKILSSAFPGKLNPNIQDDDGQSVLMLSIRFESSVRELLQLFPNLDISLGDNQGRNGLAHAALCGSIKSIEVLLQYLESL